MDVSNPLIIPNILVSGETDLQIMHRQLIISKVCFKSNALWQRAEFRTQRPGDTAARRPKLGRRI